MCCSFTGGGSGPGVYNDHQNRYELQNYTSLIHGNHVLKFGGRFRDTQDTNYSTMDSTAHSLFPR